MNYKTNKNTTKPFLKNIFEFLFGIKNKTLNFAALKKSSFKETVNHADVAKLVDALDLGSSGATCGGSIPFIRTLFFGPKHNSII